MLTKGILQNSLEVPPKKAGLLDIICQAVIAQWESMTNRLWNFRANYVQEIEIADPGDTMFWLQLYPVAEIVSLKEWTPQMTPLLGLFLPFGVTEDEPPSTEAQATTMALNVDYEVIAARGRINKIRFDPFSKRMVCTYTGGYAATAGTTVSLSTTGGSYTVPMIPANIQLAMIYQAEFMIQRMSPEKIILKSQGFKGGSAQYLDADVHPLFAAELANWESHANR